MEAENWRDSEEGSRERRERCSVGAQGAYFVFRPMGTLLAQIWNTTDSRVRVVGYKGGVAGPREPPSYLGPSRAPARSLARCCLPSWLAGWLATPISAAGASESEREDALYSTFWFSLGSLRLAAMVFCVRPAPTVKGNV